MLKSDVCSNKQTALVKYYEGCEYKLIEYITSNITFFLFFGMILMKYCKNKHL